MARQFQGQDAVQAGPEGQGPVQGTEVFAALQRGEVTARVAAQLPLTRVAEALRLAESGTVAGKVVLVP